MSTRPGPPHPTVCHQTLWYSRCYTLFRALQASMPDEKAAEQLPRARPPNGRPSVASAIHEIKNPLDSLLNLLYLLEPEATLTEKGHHYLALARDEVRRISQIAQDTLSPKKVTAKQEQANVRQLLATVLDFYKQRFEKSGITVETRWSGDKNIPAYTAPLRQLFSNLLLNAIDAMPEGGKLYARVHVGHEWDGQLRDGMRVTIADNGCGIPNPLVSQLFRVTFS